MKRFVLLVAAGVLWLFVAALPAFADGGPHQMLVNNGTSGINGDCASCHRAHTAQAADLLTANLPTLCTNCHNGTKATTDVVDGVQYTPGAGGTYQQTTVLGALRGGGFNYALMSTPSRLVTGGQYTLTFSAAPTGGTYKLTLDGTAVSIAYNATATGIRDAFFSQYQGSVADTTYTGSGAAGMTGTSTYDVTASGGPTTFTIKLNNQLRTQQHTLTVDYSTLTGATATVVWSDPMYSGNFVAKVGVAASGTATTSKHDGLGTVWGNGAVNSGAGIANVTLDCAKCHNPHGNGQYRILQTEPGEDWASTTAFAVTNGGGVEVAEVTPTSLSAGQVRNYTVNPSTDGLTTGIKGIVTDGDYWRKTYDPSGTTNFTNFYLSKDDMNAGWNGVTAVNKAANGGAAPLNSSGLMTAWCIQCHTRYNGYSTTVTNGVSDYTAGGSSASSLVANSADTLFMFKHGTTRYGCEQCHVSHGSNAAMDVLSSVNWPGQAVTASDSDSRLLKVTNRGTCQLCHDPTGTVNPGDATGTIPGTISFP